MTTHPVLVTGATGNQGGRGRPRAARRGAAGPGAGPGPVVRGRCPAGRSGSDSGARRPRRSRLPQGSGGRGDRGVLDGDRELREPDGRLRGATCPQPGDGEPGGRDRADRALLGVGHRHRRSWGLRRGTLGSWLQAARDPGRGTGFTGRGRELSGLVLDNTGEALAGLLRIGNAGANTAADHITVLDAALAQFPDPHRHGTDLLIRTDSAGAAKAFLHHIRALRERGIHAFFSVGYPVTEPVRRTIRALPETPASHLNHDTAPARPQPEEPGAPDPRVGPRPCPSTTSNQTHHRTPAQTGSAT